MDARILSMIFGIITLGALSFAGFMYFNRPGTNQTVAQATPRPSATVGEVSPTPSSDVSPSGSPTPMRTFSASQPLSVPSETTTLAEGGSLFEVASNNNMTVDDLAAFNGIADPNTVFAGQTLIIPDDYSNKTYTVLFILNKNRLTKEEQKVAAGGTSLYSDPVTAAQTDTKGIYGLGADVPYSKSAEQGATATLSTSDDAKIITVTMEKTATNLWYIKKMVIKVTK